MINQNGKRNKQVELGIIDEINKENPNLLEKDDDYFNMTNDEISALMKAYLQKTKDEDLVKITEYGGIEGIAKKLKSDISKGLDISNQDDIMRRQQVYGINELEQEKMKNCCQFVWEAFEDLMIRILCVAAIVQTVLGATIGEDPSKDWIDGMSIIIAVVIVITVGSVTNYSKEKKFKQLNDEKESMVHTDVIRNGENISIKPTQIMVGDLVHIKGGSLIPADGILVSSSFISVDESPMTGESDHIKKDTLQECLKIREIVFMKKEHKKNEILSPILCSGTQVATGEGIYLVISVGARSQKGIIQLMVKQSKSSEDSKTPLEEKLDTIAEQIGYFGMIAAAVTLIALFIRFGVSYPIIDEKFQIRNQTASLLESFYKNKDVQPSNDIKAIIENSKKSSDPNSTIAKDVLDIFLLVVAIVVVAIPEGLPLAVTLTLAFSISKMMEQKNLVRNMQACETMGGANYICSDKTGTLTQNKMLVIHVYNGKEDINIEETTNKHDTRVDPKVHFPNPRYYHDLRLAVILNIDVSKDEKGELGSFNKTDKSVYDMFVNLKERIFDVRDKYLLDGSTKKIPFNSDRKKMTTIVKNEEFPTGYRLFIKGGPDVLMDSIKSYVNPDTNELMKLTESDKQKIREDVIKVYAQRALRNVIICFKDITEDEYHNYAQQNENEEFLIEKDNLTFLAILGIRDALRPDVDIAVKKCQVAGITVVMVTGDHIDTAKAIAKQCHIIEPHNEKLEKVAMEGKTFFEEIGGIICGVCSLEKEKCECPKIKKNEDDIIAKDEIKNMDRFENIVSNLRVMGRSRPIDKYALVLGLRKLGNVVAVTGDGTNDAPALSKADVGFSMGKGGTDVAKEASDIMILDDNFASIVNAVLWGRNIYDNIRKFIQFQLTVNVTACLLVFITACIGNETPLTPIQMLWLNLIMDSLGSLALATEPPHDELLLRKPYKRSEHIINRKMWKHILIQAAFQLGILLFLYLFAPEFIIEEEPYRIAESNLILSCYNSLPGRSPKNVDGEIIYYIIHGSSIKWSEDVPLVFGKTQTDCGEYVKKQDLKTAFKTYTSNNGGTAHMTIIFNTFVVYTLFNQINARIIDDGINVFARIHKNILFIIVCFAEFGLQILLIEFGSKAFKVCRKGITGHQWGICIGFGATTFLVSFLIKVVTKLIECCTAKPPQEEIQVSIKSSLNGSLQKLDPNIVPEKKESERPEGKRKDSVLKQIVLSQSNLNRHGSVANSIRRSKKDL